VVVRRSAKPIVLVLSSYEAVTWNLNLMPGAKLKAILLGGYKSSTVVGAGDTRVVRISSYAYQAGSSGYGALDNDVQLYTGRRMDTFQGIYSGRMFTVGGR
jgi:hypothetical protein